jgi:hypothetical protein
MNLSWLILFKILSHCVNSLFHSSPWVKILRDFLQCINISFYWSTSLPKPSRAFTRAQQVGLICWFIDVFMMSSCTLGYKKAGHSWDLVTWDMINYFSFSDYSNYICIAGCICSYICSDYVCIYEYTHSQKSVYMNYICSYICSDYSSHYVDESSCPILSTLKDP